MNIPLIMRPDDSKEYLSQDYLLFEGGVESLLSKLEDVPQFDLVVTSPPYNIGKSYEKRVAFDDYMAWQELIIDQIVPRLNPGGSICWQVGNYVENGHIIPLDIEFDPIFRKTHKLLLRNRIVWKFGHGLHAKKRFSGRYEVVLWYTKDTPDYTFNLDPVRIPSLYPGKRAFKGKNAGKPSGHPMGKNPEDVWDIPNVKSNHVEKTAHPAQFPVGLIERLILALTNEGDLVFDPFAGVMSAGVAAAIHGRHFLGAEIDPGFVEIGRNRISEALAGQPVYRPHDKPIYDPRTSNLSKRPAEWLEPEE